MRKRIEDLILNELVLRFRIDDKDSLLRKINKKYQKHKDSDTWGLIFGKSFEGNFYDLYIFLEDMTKKDIHMWQIKIDTPYKNKEKQIGVGMKIGKVTKEQINSVFSKRMLVLQNQTSSIDEETEPPQITQEKYEILNNPIVFSGSVYKFDVLNPVSEEHKKINSVLNKYLEKRCFRESGEIYR